MFDAEAESRAAVAGGGADGRTGGQTEPDCFILISLQW